MLSLLFSDPSFLEELEDVKTGRVASSRFCWDYLLRAEFPWADWARRSTWSDGNGRFSVTFSLSNYYPNPTSSLKTIVWPHDSVLVTDRHRKFEEDALEAVTLAASYNPGWVAEDTFVYAAATELCIMFFEWSGKEGYLKKLCVEDPETGRVYSGPLHLVDDTAALQCILEHIKEKAEAYRLEMSRTA